MFSKKSLFNPIITASFCFLLIVVISIVVLKRTQRENPTPAEKAHEVLDTGKTEVATASENGSAVAKGKDEPSLTENDKSAEGSGTDPSTDDSQESVSTPPSPRYVSAPDGREYGILTPEWLAKSGIETQIVDGYVIPKIEHIPRGKDVIMTAGTVLLLPWPGEYSLHIYYVEKDGVKSLIDPENGERLFEEAVQLNKERNTATLELETVEDEIESADTISNDLQNRRETAQRRLTEATEARNRFGREFGFVIKTASGSPPDHGFPKFYLVPGENGSKYLRY